MLIELWLDQPVWLIIVILAAFFLVTAVLIRWLTLGRLTGEWVARSSGVVAPFFGAVALLFGLLTGFVSNDAWERSRQASRAILTERDGLVAIHDLSMATVSDMSNVRAAVRNYLEIVVNDEWPRLRNGEFSPKAVDALRELLRETADPRITAEAGQVAHFALLDQAIRVRSARSDRIALSEQYSDHPRWWTVLLLACLTQLALALVHLEKPRAQAAALAVFSASAVVALGLVAIKERPFDGPLALEPTALREAIATIRVDPAPPAAAPTSPPASTPPPSR